MQQRPEWTLKKPVSDRYFVGIGYGQRSIDGTHLQVAKNNALQDLISEISVTVSSVSVLQLIDNNKEFQEEYQSRIKTVADDEIEEFELVDSFDDLYGTWVYYRLSKARYRAIKEEKKRNAISLGLDFYSRGKENERAGELTQALAFYLRGFQSLRDYLGEAIEAEYQGKKIFLANELYGSIQENLAKVNISAPEEIYHVNRRLEKGLAVPVLVRLPDGKPISNFPITARFEVGSGLIHPNYTTSALGSTNILVSRFDSKEARQKVKVKPDLNRLVQSLSDDPLTSLIIGKMVVPGKFINFQVERPKVYMEAREQIFGASTNTRTLQNKVRSYMAEAGFDFTDNRNEAELFLEMQSDTEKGPISGSIYITYLNLSLRVFDNKTGREVYSTGLDRVRGFSLDYNRATNESYTNSLAALESETLPTLISSILH
jgi:hypothetical protein